MTSPKVHMDRICEHFERGFARALALRRDGRRRIGAEFKFPVVNQDGTAVRYETVRALWAYLADRGWTPDRDAATGAVIGARRPGEHNETVASCETGFCKSEFSLAHVGSLFDLGEAIHALRAELRPFVERHRVHFLGYGIQPITPPSRRLLMEKKSRSGVWDRVFGANRILPREDGDDVNLFTVNAASHVHVSVDRDEAIRAVNVLNGFAAAQIALTANSAIWRGGVDADYRCVAEKLWDWWIPEGDRVGIPPRPFDDLADYVRTIAAFRPVYVKRNGRPILLTGYDRFDAYYGDAEAVGHDLDGAVVVLTPEPADIDLHSTCTWYNARVSHYYTVENRANDQQPPSDLATIAALTLGLVEAADEGLDVLADYEWTDLRAARESACRCGLAGRAGKIDLADLAARMLAAARTGLERRGLGEARFLDALDRRLEQRTCPADRAVRLFEAEGLDAFLAAHTLHNGQEPS